MVSIIIAFFGESQPPEIADVAAKALFIRCRSLVYFCCCVVLSRWIASKLSLYLLKFLINLEVFIDSEVTPDFPFSHSRTAMERRVSERIEEVLYSRMVNSRFPLSILPPYNALYCASYAVLSSSIIRLTYWIIHNQDFPGVSGNENIRVLDLLLRQGGNDPTNVVNIGLVIQEVLKFSPIHLNFYTEEAPSFGILPLCYFCLLSFLKYDIYKLRRLFGMGILLCYVDCAFQSKRRALFTVCVLLAFWMFPSIFSLVVVGLGTLNIWFFNVLTAISMTYAFFRHFGKSFLTLIDCVSERWGMKVKRVLASGKSSGALGRFKRTSSIHNLNILIILTQNALELIPVGDLDRKEKQGWLLGVGIVQAIREDGINGGP